MSRDETRLTKSWKPGSLIYFSGGVHEVLPDGMTARVRHDLVPGSPKKLWRPIWTKRKRRR